MYYYQQLKSRWGSGQENASNREIDLTTDQRTSGTSNTQARIVYTFLSLYERRQDVIKH